VDSSGNAYVADTGNNAVGTAPGRRGGYATVNPIGGDGFNSPFGVAVDGSGNVFVADTFNSAVEEIWRPAAIPRLSRWAAGSIFRPGSRSMPAAMSSSPTNSNKCGQEILAAGGYTNVVTLGSGFSAPFSVAVDASGNVYVADSGNNAVKEILAAGGYVTVQSAGQRLQVSLWRHSR